MHMPPPVHGVTMVNERVASSAILTSQFEIDVLPLRFSDTVDEIGTVTPQKLVRALETGARLAWRLLRHRPDAVYVTLSPPGGAFYRDCLYVGVIKSFRVPRIYHLHAQGFAALDTGWKAGLARWVFRDAWVIQLSPVLRGDTRDLADEARVYYVANGIPDDGQARIVHFGPPRILFLSNMIAQKGPLALAAALGELAARDLAFEATFAGAGFNDGTLASFHAEVAQLGLTDRVRYVGPVYGAAKDELFRTHDIFALPTQRDAFPLVVLEAMQHGLPVVSTREGAIPDMVDEGVTGYLVAKGDGAALAARLRELVEDRALRVRLGDQARARYLAQFTVEQFEQRLAAALAQCLDHASPPR